MKRLKWIKDIDGWYGQPPVYFRIYKDRRKWILTIAEFWKKPGNQIRNLEVNSIAAGKQIAAKIWKDLVI